MDIYIYIQIYTNIKNVLFVYIGIYACTHRPLQSDGPPRQDAKCQLPKPKLPFHPVVEKKSTKATTGFENPCCGWLVTGLTGFHVGVVRMYFGVLSPSCLDAHSGWTHPPRVLLDPKAKSE